MLVFCMGMPRSASTLQFLLCRAILEGSGRGEALEWLEGRKSVRSLAALKRHAESPTIVAIKLHKPPIDKLVNGSATGGSVRAVYCHRDPRDVAISLMRKFDYNERQVVAAIDSSLNAYQRATEWLGASNVLSQPYVLLRHDMRAAAKQISEFLEAGLDPAALSAICSELSVEKQYERSSQRKVAFEHLRRRLATVMGRQVRYADDRYMMHPGHVSPKLGAEGQWRGDLDAKFVRDIEDRFSDWMKTNRYT